MATGDVEFAALTDAIPHLVWAAAPDGRVEYVNRAWAEYAGPAFEMPYAADLTLAIVHPDEREVTRSLRDRAFDRGRSFDIEHRLRRNDGSYRWFVTRIAPVRDEEGRIWRWIGAATDIDDRRRSRDGLKFVVDAGEALSAPLSPDGICNVLAQLAIGRFADWCFVSLIEADGRVATRAMAHKDAALLSHVERFRDRYPPRPGDALLKVLAENRPLLHQRVTPAQLEAAARDPEHLEILRLLRMHSVIIVPLAGPSGTVHGALSMVSAESGHLFDETDLQIAESVARRAAVAIENARVLEAERRRSQRLLLTGRINELLLDSSNYWSTMEGVAREIVESIADSCVVARIAGEALRSDVAFHADPGENERIAPIRGQRVLRPDAERALVERLRDRETVEYFTDGVDAIRERTWPYLRDAMEPFASRHSVVAPLYSAANTYGALFVYFKPNEYDPEHHRRIVEEIAARASVAFERGETIERERRIATTLQQALLPAELPHARDLQFDAVYAPAGDEAEVGGDWYDAIEMDDGSVVISVGDVTGRGIHAAAIMSKVRHAMGIVPRHELDPARILDSAHWFLRKRYPDAIVTAFVAVIDAGRRTLRYANAGHPSPFLRRDGELHPLRAMGLPLGLRHLAEPEPSASAALAQGDFLVLYTDGLIEQQRDWRVGEAALERVLRAEAVASSTNPAALIARACLPERAHDDVAILTVRLSEAPLWAFATDDARAAVDARQQFVEFLRRRAFAAEFVASAELIFGELLGNVVRHAPGRVEIAFVRTGDAYELHVIDSGEPFEESGRLLPEDDLSDAGRGLFIISHLCDALRSEHVPNTGNHVVAVLRA